MRECDFNHLNSLKQFGSTFVKFVVIFNYNLVLVRNLVFSSLAKGFLISSHEQMIVI